MGNGGKNGKLILFNVCMCMHTRVGTLSHYARVIDIIPSPICHPCIGQCPSWATFVFKVWTRLCKVVSLSLPLQEKPLERVGYLVTC